MKEIKKLFCMLFILVFLVDTHPCYAISVDDEPEAESEFIEDHAEPEEEPEESEELDISAEPEEVLEESEELDISAEPEEVPEDEEPDILDDSEELWMDLDEKPHDPTEAETEVEGSAPAANAPEYTGGSATSVNVTGAYRLNDGDYLEAWLEKSTTGSDSAFEKIGGTNDEASMITFAENGTLTPNTTYWYRTCIKTDGGTDISKASSFTTLPSVDTIDITQTEANAEISGEIALGSEDINDVIVTWSEDIGFNQNIQTTNENFEVVFSNDAYTANITGLTTGKIYYIKVEAVGPGGISEPIIDRLEINPGLPMPLVPFGLDGVIVENETDFRSALGNAEYNTIYLGSNITMTGTSNSTIVVKRTEPLVISGTDPRAGGIRHTYTDYNSSSNNQVLGGACTDITFKDITLNLRNNNGIYYAATTAATTVTFDNVTGSARQFFHGRGEASTLIVKDSRLTLSNTGQGAPQEFAETAGMVRFGGKVSITRTDTTENAIYLFHMAGASATIAIEDGADVTLDNRINTSGTNRTVFYNVDNLIIGEDVAFTCYSGQAFCTTSTANVFSNLTIGRSADVRFIHTGPNHTYNSLYGNGNSVFRMEPGSSFLIYDNERDGAWGSLYFSRIILDSPERFIVMNADNYAIGYSSASVSCTLEANGIKSLRYYQQSAVPGLFDLDAYTYTPTDRYCRWWIQDVPFHVTVTRWPSQGSAPTASTNYSAAHVPVGAAKAETSLTSGNIGLSVYGGANQTRAVEIYGSYYTVIYDGNGADSETVYRYKNYFYNEKVTVQSEGELSRTNYTFAGWNTEPNGSGRFYFAGNTFNITEDTTLYAQWTQNGYVVSGTLIGGNVSELAVYYTIDGGSVQTAITDSAGNYAIAEMPPGSTVVITPPPQTGFAVSPVDITVSSIAADSTGNDFTYTSIYMVTEKYVNEATGEAFQNDTYPALPDPSYSYDGSLDNLVVDGEIYIYQGYKIGSYRPDDPPDGTGRPAISALTADETVCLIYHKVNSTISVTFPTGNNWDFYVNQDTYPYVRTGTMGSDEVHYSVRNESDQPVEVKLTEVSEIQSGSLRLVADASISTPGSNEYSLQILPAAMPTGTVNGFTNTVTGITPGSHSSMLLGVLDGRYIGQSESHASNGYVTIGGHYAGYLSATEKNPQLMLTFTFSLVP